jgi:hypothetical protein
MSDIMSNDIFDFNKSKIFIDLLKNYNITVKNDEYSIQFGNYYNNREEYYKYIDNKLFEFVNTTLNADKNTDINRIVKNFEYLHNLKITELEEKIGIKEIWDLDKLTSPSKKRYKYIKYVYDEIFNKKRLNQDNKTFIEFFQINLLKSNISTFVILLTILNKIKKYNNDNNILNIIEEEIGELFDDEKYVKNLINFIQSEYISCENEIDIQEGNIKKKNIKFLILKMKSGGYLFFNSYLKNLYEKYSHKIDILDIEKDRKFVNYLIFIVRENTEKIYLIINKLLLTMKDYLDDMEDSYYNLINYNKIAIKNDTNKYTDKEIDNLKRNCVNINITKYIMKENEKIYKCNIPKEVLIYYDILKSYYNARYLDRIMEIDYLESTIKIKMNFDKKYTFEMNLFQYSILKLIYDNKETKLINIINKTKIECEIVEKIINGFLKIELIKRTDENINDIKFIINNNFCHEKTNLNIVHKINKININDNNYLFQKNKVIYCNLIDILKKIKDKCNETTLNEKLLKRIPFKFTNEEVLNEIKNGINIGDIKKIINNENDIYYKFTI